MIMQTHVHISMFRDGRYLNFHVTIYHESNYHDNRYYHDILIHLSSVKNAKIVNNG